jgi:cytoskeletal protein RodZ
MFRASAILKNAREDRDLDIKEVCKKLKISPKYIEAIESEKRSEFPEEPYCSLIIKDYAHFLGLNSDDILSLFRRDFANVAKSKTAGSKKWFFTPQFTFKIAIFVSIIIFASYLIMEYVKFNHPPELKINWPAGSSLTQSSFDLTGITDPDSTVRINNDLIIVDSNGAFEKKITLSSDSSKIIVESKSPSGKTTVEEKTYHLSENLKN